MKTYLVGGAVRDQLLGLPVKDRDWVVVGATPAQMLDAQYLQVGKDFPVFLHPDTHEEYALARTERKTAPGYHGFAFNTDSTVTLEQDLERRDLTINAIAQDENGQLTDPFNGQTDLKNRTLRHVSEAFSEDPVRVLRVARFMARLAPLGFQIADETLALMREMVNNQEISNLVPERVWQELESALRTTSPRAFIEALRDCGALAVILPEVDCLFGVPQHATYHPEIDSGIHTLMVLDEATQRSSDAEVRFAALCHDLGKGTTPQSEWPAHLDHETRSAELSDVLCERLKAPKKFRDLAVLVGRYHLKCHRAMELKPKTLHNLLSALDYNRKPERFEQFLVACESDAKGRGGAANNPYPQADFLRQVALHFSNVNAGIIAKETVNKALIPDAIRNAQIAAIRDYVKSLKPPSA